MNKETKDAINLDIDKKQIQVSWDCIKEVVDLHCRIYLQMFALFLAIGFSFLLAALTEKFPIIIGIIFWFFLILCAIGCILEIKKLLYRLEDYHKHIIKKLGFIP